MNTLTDTAPIEVRSGNGYLSQGREDTDPVNEISATGEEQYTQRCVDRTVLYLSSKYRMTH